ncbi:MAG TPA: hypothetical protein VF446_09705 [Trinickia sp.]
MAEELYPYGVYSIHVRPIELEGSRWDAEYEIRLQDKTVQRWTTIGGDTGYGEVTDAIESARRQAESDIEHGAGVPKPRTFP